MGQVRLLRKYPPGERRKSTDIDRGWLQYYVLHQYPDRADEIIGSGYRFYRHLDDRQWRNLRASWRRYKRAQKNSPLPDLPIADTSHPIHRQLQAARDSMTLKQWAEFCTKLANKAPTQK